ncbi:MAG TPA: hypothetical protein VKS78_20700 [Roseiarcus sp.]|nr:hypothetical protein [Roseiarcus sp.]
MVALLALVSFLPIRAEGAEPPAYLKDATAFTTHTAELAPRALPAAKVEIKGPPLTLMIDGLAAGSIQMNLDSVYSYCRRAPDDCDERLAAQVAQAMALFNRMKTPLQQSDLRAIVRTTAYVEGAEELYKAQGDLVAEPLVGDLWILCVVDMPGAMQILAPGELPNLKLSAAEALTICKRNSAVTLRPLAPSRRDYPWAGVDLITGDPYDASWLIFPERWAAIAESMQGDLLVAAPGIDMLIYGSGREEGSVAALAKAAAVVAAKAQKPLSTAVFRWTPTGWEETKP